MMMRTAKDLDFLMVGEFGRYAVNPYEGTEEHQKFRQFESEEYVEFDSDFLH
jgi:hypothetical protein